LVEIGVQPRARSLAEIARESSALEDFGRHVRDFLHEWNRAKREEKEFAPMIEEEPRLLASSFPQGDVCDAFLAALGEHLAGQSGSRAPDWVRGAGRYLTKPWFPSDGEVLREQLLREALPSFRERNLFVNARALDRV
jgi:hypothetical protein